MKILLVRHGRSAHILRGLLSRDDVESWRIAYDIAGLMPHESPPPALLQRVADASLVVSSDLPRAIESAALLRPGRQCEQSPLLRETPLPIPAIGARLPLPLWGALIALNWLRDPVNGFADTRVRSVEAARWLSELADSHESIVAVTHGAFRRYLAEALLSFGWIQSGKRSFAHWSAWELSRPGSELLKNGTAG